MTLKELEVNTLKSSFRHIKAMLKWTLSMC